jgi:hypothetical protein
MKSAVEILKKHLFVIEFGSLEELEEEFNENQKQVNAILEAMEEYASQFKGATKERVIDAEKILFDTMTENNFTYVSFPAFVENESSIDVFDIACKTIEKIASLSESDKEISEMPSDEVKITEQFPDTSKNAKQYNFPAESHSDQMIDRMNEQISDEDIEKWAMSISESNGAHLIRIWGAKAYRDGTIQRWIKERDK